MPRVREPFHVSVTELFTLGYLKEEDVLPGGHVDEGVRIHAERRYADFLERRPTSAPVRRSLPAHPKEQSFGTCVVCYTRPRDHAFAPCFHMCVCVRCASRLTTCPLCRRNVRAVHKIFV